MKPFCPYFLRDRKRAFTLIELLLVMAVVALLAALSLQSISSLQDSGNITAGAYNLSGILENARAYAMSNNTYTWVGFFEESNSVGTRTTTPINVAPPYTSPNVGRLIVCVVAAIDGTKNLTRVDPTSGLTVSNLVALQKLTGIQNLHITNLNTSLAPATGSATQPNTLSGRPVANSFLDNENGAVAAISPYTFSMYNYTFYKTISFSPRGEAELDVPSPTLQHLIEIGLLPTHGGTVNTATKNLFAIQITGLGGVVELFRP